MADDLNLGHAETHQSTGLTRSPDGSIAILEEHRHASIRVVRIANKLDLCCRSFETRSNGMNQAASPRADPESTAAVAKQCDALDRVRWCDGHLRVAGNQLL